MSAHLRPLVGPTCCLSVCATQLAFLSLVCLHLLSCLSSSSWVNWARVTQAAGWKVKVQTSPLLSVPFLCLRVVVFFFTSHIHFELQILFSAFELFKRQALFIFFVCCRVKKVCLQKMSWIKFESKLTCCCCCRNKVNQTKSSNNNTTLGRSNEQQFTKQTAFSLSEFVCLFVCLSHCVGQIMKNGNIKNKNNNNNNRICCSSCVLCAFFDSTYALVSSSSSSCSAYFLLNTFISFKFSSLEAINRLHNATCTSNEG